jgi:hypothetical protein
MLTFYRSKHVVYFLLSYIEFGPVEDSLVRHLFALPLRHIDSKSMQIHVHETGIPHFWWNFDKISSFNILNCKLPFLISQVETACFRKQIKCVLIVWMLAFSLVTF